VIATRLPLGAPASAITRPEARKGRIDRLGRFIVRTLKHVRTHRESDVGRVMAQRLQIVTMSTPASISCEAWVWRRAWNATPRRLSRAASFAHALENPRTGPWH
jgi:hypothetical protein